jgi:uncharacterized protein YfdQ (DUF2303 family)
MNPSDTQAAIDAGLQLAGPSIPTPDGGIPYLIVRQDHKLQSLEHLLPQPARIRSSAIFPDEASFCFYVTEWKTEWARLFADRHAGRVTAILDYHEDAATPSWCSHRATLQLRQSPEWQAWTSKENAWMEQVAFAEFLEDHLADIAEPAAADVLEAVRHLEAKKTVHFKSGVNLDNGTVQLQYDEAIEGKGRGNIVIPARFTLGIAPWESCSPYRVGVRLRYRITDDRLAFRYALDQARKVHEAAFGELLGRIEGETEIRPLIGSVTVNGRAEE